MNAIPIILALAVAIIPHEVAHGYVAYRLGDPTAYSKGRLTLNPIVHIDPVGSVLLPLLLILLPGNIVFGWAKPVPVNPVYFRNPKQGMMLVGAAGPLTNFTFAAVGILLYKLFAVPQDSAVGFFLIMLIVVNTVLGMLNALPVPPLDGSRILTGLLPDHLARQYNRIQPFGFIIILFILLAGGLEYIVAPIIHGLFSFLGISFL